MTLAAIDGSRRAAWALAGREERPDELARVYGLPTPAG